MSSKLLFTTALVLSTFSVCKSLPNASPQGRATVSVNGSPPVTIQSAIDPYLYECTVQQQGMVLEAWNEAGLLAAAHDAWEPPGWIFSGAYQAAMAMYLGDNSQNDYSLLTGNGPLKKNIERQYGIHGGPWAPRSTCGYFYCDESKEPAKKNGQKRCTCCLYPQHRRIHLGRPGLVLDYTLHHLLPLFFRNALTSLSARVQQAQGSPSLQRVINLWRLVRAHTLFHETYHWKGTVSRPKCDLLPERYQPRDVYGLARGLGTQFAKLNAESWAQSAMAIYLQIKFSLQDPPTPREYAPPSVQNDELVNATSDTDVQQMFFEAAPDWFDAPVKQPSEWLDPWAPLEVDPWLAPLPGTVKLSSLRSNTHK